MKKLSIVLGLAISILTANMALAFVPNKPYVCPRKLAATMLRGSNEGNAYTQQIAQNNSNFGSSSDGVHRQK